MFPNKITWAFMHSLLPSFNKAYVFLIISMENTLKMQFQGYEYETK